MKSFDDVVAEITLKSAAVGGVGGDSWLLDDSSESPIERLFAMAIRGRKAWQDDLEVTYFHDVDDDVVGPLVMEIDGKVKVAAQVAIGPYRVDFLFARRTDDGLLMIAIECDGHEFHEKTQKQAARDKARDRAIMARGIRVLRFTGSEIWRDAVGCLDQVLAIFKKDSDERWEKRVAPHGSYDAYCKAMRLQRQAKLVKSSAGLLSVVG